MFHSSGGGEVPSTQSHLTAGNNIFGIISLTQPGLCHIYSEENQRQKQLENRYFGPFHKVAMHACKHGHD